MNTIFDEFILPAKHWWCKRCGTDVNGRQCHSCGMCISRDAFEVISESGVFRKMTPIYTVKPVCICNCTNTLMYSKKCRVCGYTLNPDLFRLLFKYPLPGELPILGPK